MTKLKIALVSAFLLGASALASDVTGKWSGTAVMKTPDGQSREDTAWMSLKQAGSALTGTAGPAADRQAAIQDGKVDGDRLEFKINVEDAFVSIRLHSEAERLKGEAVIETPDGKITANLDLKRVP